MSCSKYIHVFGANFPTTRRLQQMSLNIVHGRQRCARMCTHNFVFCGLLIQIREKAQKCYAKDLLEPAASLRSRQALFFSNFASLRVGFALPLLLFFCFLRSASVSLSGIFLKSALPIMIANRMQMCEAFLAHCYFFSLFLTTMVFR